MREIQSFPVQYLQTSHMPPNCKTKETEATEPAVLPEKQENKPNKGKTLCNTSYISA